MSALETVVHVIDNKETGELLSWILGTIGLKIKSYQGIQDFLDHYNPIQPGCLLLDSGIQNLDVHALQKKLKIEDISTLPIIITSWINDIYIAVNMMKEGAIDFLLKPLNEEMLIDSVNRALKISRSNIKKLQEIYQTREKYYHLSSREKQIFQGIVAGKSSKTISIEIAISPKTIEAHRASMMKKMEVKSVSNLVKMLYYIENNSS